jgi:hypothetical protein
MPILPGFLEHSEKTFLDKLKILATQNFFDQEIHLDVVYPQFAKDRNVLSSLNLTSQVKIINKYITERGVDKYPRLSIHLMGELEDDSQISSDLIFIEKNYKSELISEIFLPNFKILPKIENNKQIFAYWYDLDSWPKCVIDKGLIMTVKAGKSGQILEEETKHRVFIMNSYKEGKLLFDGGWKISDLDLTSNSIRLVSNSDFWKKYNL